MYEDIYNQIMQKVDGLVAEDRIDQAVDILDRAVYGFVERKDFWHAKDCYNRLMDVNPLALSEIIRVADFIERAVYENINADHRTAWKDLYSDLSREMAVNFYLSLEEVGLKQGDELYKQHDLNNKLFFIESGNLGLYAETKFSTIRLATLHAGDMAGIEGFLHTAYCSNTAKAEAPTVKAAKAVATPATAKSKTAKPVEKKPATKPAPKPAAKKPAGTAAKKTPVSAKKPVAKTAEKPAGGKEKK